MKVMDYIDDNVKLTEQEFTELIHTVKKLEKENKKLEKENKKLKARVTKLEDDVNYYKNSKAYDGWDGGGGF